MRTVRLKVYQFNELSDVSKQNALNVLRYTNVQNQWYDFIYEHFIDKQKLNGFEVEKIYFSGFSSQGDGAVFTGTVKDFSLFTNGLNPHFAKSVKRNLFSLTYTITHHNRYYHENSATHEFWYNTINTIVIDNPERIIEQLSLLENNIENAFKAACLELYKLLEITYEDLISNEQVQETIIANNFEFEKDGTLF